ncbi:uncharacterized protein LOC110228366 isoform X2 [Arabidopsis lyrata subsp. lyrata]|uniref:uncharacterized protein LOC110228366 isoform X2 n=1 Tax=Arabidopsis lyrata subsp. lyrata TaxID=81972 RepID=UPI000A29B5FA|nr:uncharacterized protein LOC110228366 isoform X2 [Arabidopsis lyrata subsp. lyrata]|eukprot:XP_020881257.1 uncharacterized protein LOC110228366 isoform X2 [Arabidopsis lyrata subsp. lyrata]
MEDVLTENPPPSRFFQEDLNNFVPPPESLPSPFIIFSNPKPELPLRPSLLIIAISSPSLYIFHNLPSKTLLGSLIMHEVPFSGNTMEPLRERELLVACKAEQIGISAQRRLSRNTTKPNIKWLG